MDEWVKRNIEEGRYVVIGNNNINLDGLLDKCDSCGGKMLLIQINCSNGSKQYIQACESCRRRTQAIAHPGRKSRHTVRYDQEHWAFEVKDYYNGRCAICGSDEGVEAHHIIPYSVCEKYRDSLKNGILLCKKCHEMAHENDSKKWKQEVNV